MRETVGLIHGTPASIRAEDFLSLGFIGSPERLALGQQQYSGAAAARLVIEALGR